MKTIDYPFLVSKLALTSNIAIITHINPDGDAVGSALALFNFFKQSNHKVNVIIPNGIPNFLSWLPSADKIIFGSKHFDLCKEIISKADFIFCVDFNSIDRMNKFSDEYQKSNAIKILIDHHPNPGNFSDFIYSDTNVSSTAEMIYNFIKESGQENKIDKDISECLYVGIITDTGSFSYSSNNAETYRITAELLKYKINPQQIHNLIYDTFSENRLRLLGYCLSDALTVLPDYKTAYIALSKDDLKKFNYQTGDTEDFVNYPISIKNIIYSALFMELGNEIKISFRSKGDNPVNDFAAKYFNGGGHKNAAGGSYKASLADT
ncbi:MAG: bifunctional oligoribonuclease/PAP phosphatase NrnA, partial [Bacteroidales bacterium]|nr:bifunctional oligoribonuclease/PAP phosphatase NrnA [Bacteroidales bacterium]